MTVGFDAVHGEVVVGTHLVLRLPGLAAVIRRPDASTEDAAPSTPTGELLDLLDRLAKEAGPTPGRELARRLTRWVVSTSAAPEFGAVAATEDGLAVFLHGDVSFAELPPDSDPGVSAAAAPVQLSGRTAAFTVDRLLPRSPAPIALTAGPPLAARPGPSADGGVGGRWSGLVLGLVPGGGIVLSGSPTEESGRPVPGPAPESLGRAAAAGGRHAQPAERPVPDQGAARPSAPPGGQDAAPAEGHGPAAGSGSPPQPAVPDGSGPPGESSPAVAVAGSASDSSSSSATPRSGPGARVAESAPIPAAASVPPPIPPARSTPAADLPPPAGQALPAPPVLPDSPVPPPPGAPAPELKAPKLSAQIHGSHQHEAPRKPLPVARKGSTPPPAPRPGAAAPAHAVVKGFRCSRGHLNDPRVSFCSVCGIRMDQSTAVLVDGRRPPLGLLVLDIGSTFVLDDDYLIGRNPEVDQEVIAGRLRPIRLDDDSGTLSRVHAEIRLQGWDVVLVDRGSANGTYAAGSGQPGWSRLAPRQPLVLSPGTHVRLGRRTFTFESSASRL